MLEVYHGLYVDVYCLVLTFAICFSLLEETTPPQKARENVLYTTQICIISFVDDYTNL